MMFTALQDAIKKHGTDYIDCGHGHFLFADGAELRIDAFGWFTKHEPPTDAYKLWQKKRAYLARKIDNATRAFDTTKQALLDTGAPDGAEERLQKIKEIVDNLQQQLATLDAAWNASPTAKWARSLRTLEADTQQLTALRKNKLAAISLEKYEPVHVADDDE